MRVQRKPPRITDANDRDSHRKERRKEVGRKGERKEKREGGSKERKY